MREKSFQEKVRRFQNNVFEPSLKTHKLSGKLKDYWSFSVEYDLRIIFYYAAEEDEDYKEINGKWLNEEPYGVVHRVASTGIVRGAASFCLDWAYAQTQNLRMDTYNDNIPMQKLLEKCGFQYCGSFERLGMDKWMAYQKI